MTERLAGDSAAKTLGFWSLTAIVVANMIGAGVYTTSGFTLDSLGSRPVVLAAWAVAGVVAALGAVSYGLLVRELMASGGEYLFLSRWVHPLAGFLAGWVSYIAGFSAAGAIAAHAFERYVVTVWPPLGSLPSHTLAVLLVIAAALLHGANARGGAYGQNAVVAIKLLLIAAFLAVAAASLGDWPGIQQPSSRPLNSDWTLAEFCGAVVWISLSYAGFNAAIYVAGEANCPPRRVAASMVAATLVTTLIYLLLNAVFLYAAPPASIAGQPEVATIAADAIGGRALATFVGIIICIGLASSVLSLVQIGPRVYATMADDGLLPRWFAAERPPPRRSIFFQAASMIVVIWFTTLRDLLGFLGLTLAISSAFAVAAYVVLCFRRRSLRSTANGGGSGRWAATERLWMAAPLAYVAATAGMIAMATLERPGATAASLLAISVGVPLYFAMRWTMR